MEKITIRQATKKWLKEFNHIPGSVFETFAKTDESVSYYDSDLFRLTASPLSKCGYCDAHHNWELTLQQLNRRKVPCSECEKNEGDDWHMSYPEYAFPCGWGTLFSPQSWLDQDWLEKNYSAIAELGFFVFESEHFGYLLGIDAGGFDFYEAFWIPLYKLRGLQWHTETSLD
jgi:hypothetical protein